MLRVIAVACDDVWMTPATTTKYMLSALLSSTRTTVAFVSLYDDRRWRVNVSLIKAVEAVRAVGTVIPCADVTLAEAWLYGFAMFPVLELPKVNTGETYVL